MQLIFELNTVLAFLQSFISRSYATRSTYHEGFLNGLKLQSVAAITVDEGRDFAFTCNISYTLPCEPSATFTTAIVNMPQKELLEFIHELYDDRDVRYADADTAAKTLTLYPHRRISLPIFKYSHITDAVVDGSLVYFDIEERTDIPDDPFEKDFRKAAKV
jgi:hypothetical protein